MLTAFCHALALGGLLFLLVGACALLVDLARQPPSDSNEDAKP